MRATITQGDAWIVKWCISTLTSSRDIRDKKTGTELRKQLKSLKAKHIDAMSVEEGRNRYGEELMEGVANIIAIDSKRPADDTTPVSAPEEAPPPKRRKAQTKGNTS